MHQSHRQMSGSGVGAHRIRRWRPVALTALPLATVIVLSACSGGSSAPSSRWLSDSLVVGRVRPMQVLTDNFVRGANGGGVKG